MIAMANYQVKDHFVECEECNGWYDPNESPTITVSRNLGGRIGIFDYDICVNCAELAGVAVCAVCAETSEESDLNDCGGDMMCTDCMHDSGYSNCYNCEDVTEDSDMRDCNGEYLCEFCAAQRGWHECEACREWTGPDDSYTSPGGDHYCEGCFWEIYTCCDGCSETIHRDDARYTDCDCYCDGCYRGGEDGDNFSCSGFRDRDGCTTHIGSERCYGLELETDKCSGYTDLDGSAAWGAKDDCSVFGKEFVSDILSGDAGLAAIAELTELADANGWDAGRNCGYHLHLDMRSESDDSLVAAAYAYYVTRKVWYELVSQNRWSNGFCGDVEWDVDDLVDWTGTFRNFVYDHVAARQTWINLRAYVHHSTFEIRLHHATLDELAVCNWIKAHTRFVDWACTVGLAEVRRCLDGKDTDEQFDFIMNEVWRDDKLGAYYAERSGRADFAVAVA